MTECLMRSSYLIGLKVYGCNTTSMRFVVVLCSLSMDRKYDVSGGYEVYSAYQIAGIFCIVDVGSYGRVRLYSTPVE